jgi:predicted AlkP superfamily pyrophosphatase or phosphodiesterase
MKESCKLDTTNNPNEKTKKRIILLLLDSLMTTPLQNAIENGQARALKFFLENGQLYPELVSPFPTMSVNVDSSLITGVYCDKHKIPGLVWFHQDEKRIINYGSHIRELIKLGLNQTMIDIVYNLNNVHLSDDFKTIHEELALINKQSASINTLMYRGSTVHSLKIPRLLSWITGIPSKVDVNAPSIFSYGAMSKFNPVNRTHYFWRKYGFHNEFSINELIYFIKEKKLPDFSIVYFPDADQSVHKNGRSDQKGIKKMDEQLTRVLNSFHTWEDALTENIWIILGDNGQAWIGKNKKEALIDLREALKTYNIVKLKKGITPQDQVLLGVNERMAFVYSLNTNRLPLEEIAKVLQNDSRIELIGWKERKTIHVISGEIEGKLSYHPDGEYMDEYGQKWTLKGTKEILDLQINDKKIQFGNFPDGLARLYSSFFSHKGEYLVITAKPGYELIGEGSPTHVGGASHGGLHKQDSLVPMIVSGTDSSPKHLRIKDLKEWILSLIN